MRSYSVLPKLSQRKTYSLTRPSSIQRTPAIRRREVKVGDMWLEDWPGPQLHLFHPAFGIIDFMGSLVFEKVLWHF
jgi:hypothetical protein